MSTDLVRVEVRGAWKGETHPRFVGRALNAWLYGELARRDPEATTALHESIGAKPLAIALVDGGCRLVFSGYGPAVPAVLAIAQSWTGRVLLDAHWWESETTAKVEAAEWSQLAAPLLAEAPPTVVRLQFDSPATFRSRGHSVPLPVPELVFGSLLDRWHTSSPIHLGEGAWTTVVEHAVLRRFRGVSVPVQTAGFQPGFVGTAEFGLRRPPPEYRGLLAVLAGFAPFAGVGAKVGMGMGSVTTPISRDF